MTQGICDPILFVDLAGSICLIIVSALCLKEARNIAKKQPDNFLYGYLYWLFIALFAFSLSRSLGHIVKHLLLIIGMVDYWKALSPVSGSINTALFFLISSITVFFQKMKRVMERIERDRTEIERISQELLRLNKETELLVSERTRAELALSIAHHIRNPIMVIGGLARRFLKKDKLSKDQHRKIELMLEQIEKLDKIVREFEAIKGKKTESISREDLNEVVREVADAALPEAKRHGIDINVKYESAPLFVSMDPDLVKFSLAQCLKLLIHRLGPSKKILVNLSREKFGALITLFTSEFGKFGRKGPKMRTPQGALSGKRLGLSTIKQILEDHGGEFKVEGQGQYIMIQIFLPFSIGIGKTWGGKRATDAHYKNRIQDINGQGK